MRLSDYRNEVSMTKISTNSTPQLFNLIFVIAFSFLFCLTTFGQSNSFGEKLNANNKSDSNKISKPEIERQRVVEKNKSDEKVNKLLAQFEHQAFEILNQRRTENGLSAIKWCEDMAKVARVHSLEMAQFKYFSHAGRDGKMVNDRADLLGFSNWQALGENIAFSRGYEKPAELACEGWMKSPAHRDNILNTRWKEAGIGVAQAADGSFYFTEVFIMR